MNKFVEVFIFVNHMDVPIHLATFYAPEEEFKSRAIDWNTEVKTQVALMEQWMFHPLTVDNCTIVFFQNTPNIPRYYSITKSGMLVEYDEAFRAV